MRSQLSEFTAEFYPFPFVVVNGHNGLISSNSFMRYGANPLQ